MRWINRITFLAFTTAASAQILYVGDVVDAASYTTGIARGTVFVVKGSFPVPDGLTVSSLPFGQSLNGIAVVLNPVGGGTAVRAWMQYTYGGIGGPQLAAVLPSTMAPGMYNVSVVSGSTTVTGGKARVVERKFRSLTNNQEGYGLAVAQNYVSPERVDRNMFVAGSLSDGQTKSPANPGQIVILWGLGLGAIAAPDNEAPGAIDLRSQIDVKVAVGGIDAPVFYAGRSPQFPGIDQINFAIPQNAPLGCNVALQVTVNGEASNPVTIAISAPGKNACEHPVLSLQQLESLDQGKRFLAGEFNVMVYVEQITYQGAIHFVEIHSSIGYFGWMTASRAGALDYRSVAPGYCTLVRGDENTRSLLDAGADDSANGGTLSVSGPNLPDVPLNGDDDYYYRLFSAKLEDSDTILAGDRDHRLTPAPHKLRGLGGSNVGPFEADLPLSEFLEWTNRDAIAQVDRNTGLEVTWTGGGTKDFVIIEGGTGRSANDGSTEIATFICVAQPGSTSFTVPSEVLRSIPDTSDPYSGGMVVVAAFSDNSTTRFDAPLTDGGQLGSGSFGSLMMVTKVLPYR